MAVDIDTMSWEGIVADRTKWRIALKLHLLSFVYHRIISLTQSVGAMPGQWPNFKEAIFGWWSM